MNATYSRRLSQIYMQPRAAPAPPGPDAYASNASWRTFKILRRKKKSIHRLRQPLHGIVPFSQAAPLKTKSASTLKTRKARRTTLSQRILKAFGALRGNRIEEAAKYRDSKRISHMVHYYAPTAKSKKRFATGYRARFQRARFLNRLTQSQSLRRSQAQESIHRRGGTKSDTHATSSLPLARKSSKTARLARKLTRSSKQRKKDAQAPPKHPRVDSTKACPKCHYSARLCLCDVTLTGADRFASAAYNVYSGSSTSLASLNDVANSPPIGFASGEQAFQLAPGRSQESLRPPPPLSVNTPASDAWTDVTWNSATNSDRSASASRTPIQETDEAGKAPLSPTSPLAEESNDAVVQADDLFADSVANSNHPQSSVGQATASSPQDDHTRKETPKLQVIVPSSPLPSPLPRQQTESMLLPDTSPLTISSDDEGHWTALMDPFDETRNNNPFNPEAESPLFDHLDPRGCNALVLPSSPFANSMRCLGGNLPASQSHSTLPSLWSRGSFDGDTSSQLMSVRNSHVEFEDFPDAAGDTSFDSDQTVHGNASEGVVSKKVPLPALRNDDDNDVDAQSDAVEATTPTATAVSDDVGLGLALSSPGPLPDHLRDRKGSVCLGHRRASALDSTDSPSSTLSRTGTLDKLLEDITKWTEGDEHKAAAGLQSIKSVRTRVGEAMTTRRRHQQRIVGSQRDADALIGLGLGLSSSRPVVNTQQQSRTIPSGAEVTSSVLLQHLRNLSTDTNNSDWLDTSAASANRSGAGAHRDDSTGAPDETHLRTPRADTSWASSVDPFADEDGDDDQFPTIDVSSLLRHSSSFDSELSASASLPADVSPSNSSSPSGSSPSGSEPMSVSSSGTSSGGTSSSGTSSSDDSAVSAPSSGSGGGGDAMTPVVDADSPSDRVKTLRKARLEKQRNDAKLLAAPPPLPSLVKLPVRRRKNVAEVAATASSSTTSTPSSTSSGRSSASSDLGSGPVKSYEYFSSIPPPPPPSSSMAGKRTPPARLSPAERYERVFAQSAGDSSSLRDASDAEGDVGGVDCTPRPQQKQTVPYSPTTPRFAADADEIGTVAGADATLPPLLHQHQRRRGGIRREAAAGNRRKGRVLSLIWLDGQLERADGDGDAAADGDVSYRSPTADLLDEYLGVRE